MTELPEVPERISERKVIVYKSSIDPTIMKLIVEKMKKELFAKPFSDHKPEEIRVVSVDKYYEPYLLVDAKYNIDYCKKRVHILDVEEKAQEVRILGEACEPETVAGAEGEPRRVIRLEVKECLSHKDKVFIVLDKKGREIQPEQVFTAPSENHPHEILKEFGKKVGKLEISPQKEIKKVKARIAKRPTDADEIQKELFQISEHVAYSPLYRITFRNVRTGDEKTIKIDGVSARIKTNSFPKQNLKSKM